MRRRLLFLSLLLVPLAARAQQVGVLTHDAVLHDGPSRTAPRLGDVAAGETVSLLRREHRNGYLQVRTQTEDVGWVWELYVHLVDPTEVHEPTTPHTLVPSPLGVDVPAGDFDNCPDSGDAQLARVRVLNRLKNRSAEPRDADIDSSVTLAAMLAPTSGDSGDLEHQAQAENTNAGNSANWRATAWEIHPITFLAAAVSPP